jgi:hypothetical protein
MLNLIYRSYDLMFCVTGQSDEERALENQARLTNVDLFNQFIEN